TIIALPVDVSHPVKKGDLLVQLDPVDEKRSVQQAQVQQAQSQAKLAQSKLNLVIAQQSLATEKIRADANLGSANSKAADSKAKFERTRQLFEKKMASPEELGTDQLALAQADADAATAQARIDDLKTLQTQIGLREQDINIAEQMVQSDSLALEIANQRLTDTTVPSPIDGVVSELDVQVGQIIASGINNVGGGTPALKLADLSHIYVMVSVDESDIGRVEMHQQVDITVDAYPDVLFPGEVMQIATKGVVASNVVTYNVKVEVKGSNRRLLKPEMTANVQIVVADKTDALTVPSTAVVRQKREWVVEVRKPDGSVERRAVKTGANNGEAVEILDGLQEGESVKTLPAGQQNRWQKGSGAGEPGGGATGTGSSGGASGGSRPRRPEGHPE
ncbi:MAG TPA: efflux RND transporter periplasmic adaptor subunit, partial [Planctomycetota bacterium]|nr:efflux RND transporter periplasmic adaptor subunit [Planctomycetota bacterium]